MRRFKLIVAIFGALLVFFACDKKELPEVKTKEVSNITENSAVCGGNVIDDGGSFIVGRGVCWSTSSEPTLNDSYTFDGNGIGTFNSNMTNLKPNTTYYVRAYATNDNGTSYGEQKSFKTTVLSSQELTLDDFLGTYDVKAYNCGKKAWETWSGTTMKIDEYNTLGENTIVVYGIMYGAEYDFFRAYGKYDDTHKCIRLFSNYGGGYFYITNNDTAYRAYFYPVYQTADSGFYLITTGGSDGTNEVGEAWLTLQSDGTLSLGASNTPDSSGLYANGFVYFYVNPSYVLRGHSDVYNQVTLTKTSKATAVTKAMKDSPGKSAQTPLGHKGEIPIERGDAQQRFIKNSK